jgi:hypothetical protein
MEKQKIIWKRMRNLLEDFDRKKFSFRELVEKLMLAMDANVFLDGTSVKIWYEQWIHMWDLAMAGDMEMDNHLDLACRFASELKGFLSEEIERLEGVGESLAVGRSEEGGKWNF